MIQKTRGIVLRTQDFSDTSLIVKIYTESFGIQSYLIKGAKRKNAGIRANIFQPLSLLNLSVYKIEKKNLQTIKEVNIETHFISIPKDPTKIAILLFVNEVILKCVQEEENNVELFSFLHESLTELEAAEKQFANFYLIFLIRLSRYLGFYPQGKFSETSPIFDLQEGKFIAITPLHPKYLDKENSRLLQKLLSSSYYNMDSLGYSAEDRKSLLDILLRFYQMHLSNMNNLSSHKILEQVFT